MAPVIFAHICSGFSFANLNWDFPIGRLPTASMDLFSDSRAILHNFKFILHGLFISALCFSLKTGCANDLCAPKPIFLGMKRHFPTANRYFHVMLSFSDLSPSCKY
jgi:hypothetical protein